MAKANKTKQKTWKQALKALQSGNQNFVNDQLSHQMIDKKRRKQLTAGQWPWAIVLTCADSRVTPELVFDTGIGELFVVRVAGNIANTSSLASIEYAVANLGVRLVVVLGHEGCGAVSAALAGGNLGYNLNHLLAHIKPAVSDKFKARTQKAKLNEAVMKNAANASQELIDRSPILSSTKAIKVLPAIYRLGTGQVDYLDSKIA